jgi:hypothetical protein
MGTVGPSAAQEEDLRRAFQLGEHILQEVQAIHRFHRYRTLRARYHPDQVGFESLTPRRRWEEEIAAAAAAAAAATAGTAAGTADTTWPPSSAKQ